MGYAEDWGELMFDLRCLNKGSAKRQFKQAIRYAFGGLCAYCRCKRATTIDHLKPKCKGGEDLRSNLVPACRECNHSKGSEDWLPWYQRQEFYSDVAQELIEEWIANKRLDIEDYDERTINNRTTVCLTASSIRSHSNEPPCSRKDSRSTPACTYGTKKRCSTDVDDERYLVQSR